MHQFPSIKLYPSPLQAMQLDPSFANKVAQIVFLGGCFFRSGNVNPACEANVFCDPKAADVVFTSGADVLVVGLNVTERVVLTSERTCISCPFSRFIILICLLLLVPKYRRSVRLTSTNSTRLLPRLWLRNHVHIVKPLKGKLDCIHHPKRENSGFAVSSFLGVSLF